MGLDTSHDCWRGAYSAFMRWRQKLAEVAGLPPLELMEGFYHSVNDMNNLPTLFCESRAAARESFSYLDSRLPISWDCLQSDILYRLLYHSDCDGSLEADICGPLADRLVELLPLLPDEEDAGHIGVWKEKTQKFIDGLRLAASLGEDVEFH